MNNQDENGEKNKPQKGISVFGKLLICAATIVVAFTLFENDIVSHTIVVLAIISGIKWLTED